MEQRKENEKRDGRSNKERTERFLAVGWPVESVTMVTSIEFSSLLVAMAKAR